MIISVLFTGTNFIFSTFCDLNIAFYNIKQCKGIACIVSRSLFIDYIKSLNISRF